jgi:hypothetical protein
MTSMHRFVWGLALLSVSFLATAQQQPIIYPAKGQSPQQQQKDTAECQTWSTQSTGIDPVILAQTPVSSGSSSGGGERVKGAVGGAVGGLAIGAITGNAGKGAAIGAVTGTMVGGHNARKNQQAQQQYSQAQRQDMMNTWNRAVGACMSARGYTIG